MKLAWALQVTAGVTVASGSIAPVRAIAVSRGVWTPKCLGVSPTKMIANSGFNRSSSPLE
jgi:hypothetical protein